MDTTVELQPLLDRLATGDARAKSDLVNRAHDRMMVLTRQLLGSFSQVRAAEETAGVLNDAYLRLHSAIDEVKPTSARQFLGLVALSVRRVLLDRVRRMRGRGAAARPRSQSLDAAPGDSGPGLDVAADHDPTRADLVFDLLESVGALGDEEREVVELKFFHGLTEAEAGRVLGVHEDTVKRRWAKARIRLAGRLAPFAP